jgi:hypothetical protein
MAWSAVHRPVTGRPLKRRKIMTRSSRRKVGLTALALTTAAALVLAPAPRIDAADHLEAPIVAQDLGADIADVYFFLDPNDNSQVVAAMTVRGFIVPVENANAGFFDSSVRFRFAFENTGDATPDHFFDVTFSKQTSRSAPQVATIKENGVTLFTAPTTVASSTARTAPPPVITTDPTTGIRAFGGLIDDPFFFDLGAELAYINSLLANHPNPAVFERARDSFAGYNALVIALRIPASRLSGPAGDVVGLTGQTWRAKQFDRMGLPAVNTVLVPYSRKDEYNSASTYSDSTGRFRADIVQTLTKLHTNSTYIGIFESLAVTKGDMLRLDLSIPNTGTEGGKNVAARFPNGRRPNDDVIDTIVTLVNNGVALKDNVNDNDVGMRGAFPFFAAPAQPFPAGVIDDRTRN